MLTIHTEGLCGSDVTDCAQELIDLAKKLDVIAAMKFNGTEMWAYPASTVESVMKMFRSLQDQKG